jgi:ABC-type Fe3+/spermidine/putrescine transport system ATPase subunit
MRVELTGITKRFGPLKAVDDVSLAIGEGDFFTLLGPSGCGKTTLLRTLAGFHTPDAGEIRFDGRVINDIPPHRRQTGMVFQNYALFPHLTVFDNIAYGLRARKIPRREIKARIGEVIRSVQLEGLEDRAPSRLSGGQQQRVALARALATEPAILLLDEPLSNLDALLREKMRFEIRSLQQRLGITTIYVTHSQEEALVLSDIVATMHEGRLVQLGPPEELYRRPRTRFVATFSGWGNIWEGTARGREAAGEVVELPDGQRIGVLADTRLPAAARVSVMVRPECVRLAANGGSAVPENRLRGRVESVTFTGSRVDYFVAVAGLAEPVRVQTTPPIAARPGEEVALAFSVTDCVLLED